jgi:S1-C subfamily serine protease
LDVIRATGYLAMRPVETGCASSDIRSFKGNEGIAMDQGMRQIVKNTADGVVALRNEDGSTASGLAWRKGYVVTADEAVGDRVKVVTGGGTDIAAELAGRDPSTDIALFKADVAHHPFEASAETHPGDFAIAVGRGATSELVAAGFIAETGPQWESLSGGKIERKIRLGFKVDRRSHGGAVVDAAGRLIGLAAFAPRRRAIVIPVQTIERITALLEKSGTISRGYIGVQLHPLRDAQRPTGAIIVHLDREGPAAAAGLNLGDSIVSWNGEDVTGPRQIFRYLSPDRVGTTVALGILRGGQRSTVDIVVGKRPA